MVVVRKTVTNVGHSMHTRTEVIILTDPTVSDSTSIRSNYRVRLAFIGWSIVINVRITRHVGSVRKVLPNFLNAGKVVPS